MTKTISYYSLVLLLATPFIMQGMQQQQVKSDELLKMEVAEQEAQKKYEEEITKFIEELKEESKGQKSGVQSISFGYYV